MSIRWKKRIVKFIKHTPGKRFQHYYQLINRKINHNIYLKVLFSIIGSIFFLLGVIMLFTPGPGLLFILLGILLLCLISHRLSIFFDRQEEKIARWVEKYRNGGDV